MAKPTMVLSSLKVYDDTTIRKWIESERYYDPMTGIPMAVGQWQLLLYPRTNLQEKIERFLVKYPALRAQQFDESDQTTDWEALFKVYELKIKEKYIQMAKDQSELRVRAKQIFKPLDLESVKTRKSDVLQIEDEAEGKSANASVKQDAIGIEYDESIVLLPDIPIVCFMGPSRNGKSTIVNDILGVKEACGVSFKSDIALTKGAWITLYSSKGDPEPGANGSDDSEDQKEVMASSAVTKPEFYVLDMEGLSHQVTKFTKRLFYACYATANVVIWNDKNVASDEFKTLMKELKSEMQDVAESSTKPAFLYLKRDADDYDFDPYATFDEYINKNASFQWFREMNIFSSISAYELDRPRKDLKLGKGRLNFHSLPENQKLLQPLIAKIVNLTSSSQRFSSTMYVLKEQIQHINKSTALSMTRKYIAENEVLSKFLIAPKGDIYRFRDMVYVACYFNWDHAEIEKKFNTEIAKFKASRTENNKADPRVIAALRRNKDEIYERVKNKIEHKQYAKNVGMAGGLGFGGVVGLGMLLTGTGIPVALTGFVLYGGCAGLAGYGVGKGAEIVNACWNWVEYGHYMRYTLGKTDEELKQETEGPKSKTKADEWDDEDWENFMDRCGY